MINFFGHTQRQLSPLQLALIIIVCLLIVGIEVVIMSTYFTIGQATSTYEQSAFLSADLANVQRELLRLQVVAHYTLDNFQGDMSALDKQRSLLRNQLRLIRKNQTIIPLKVAQQLNQIVSKLEIYDSLVEPLRHNPTPKEVNRTLGQLDQLLTALEKDVKAAYDTQETSFFQIVHQALNAQHNSQWLLIGLNGVIIIAAIVLILSLSRSVSSEFKLAYQQLEVQILERTRAEQELRHQNDYLAALHETTVGLVSRLNLTDLLEDIMERAGQLVGTKHGFIGLIEPNRTFIELKIGMGLYKNHMDLEIKSGQGMAGQVWQTGQPLKIDNYDSWPQRVPDFPYQVIHAIIGIPLKSGEQVVGVLGLVYGAEAPQFFTEAQIELLTRFAQLATIALDNARLYRTAQEARITAEVANEAKSDFLANVSHELRTPLTSVLGFAKIIQKRFDQIIRLELPTDSPKVSRASQQISNNLNIIVSEGERLTELINNVLDLAKIEAGRTEWHMHPLALNEIIERATSATASLFSKKRLTLVKDIPPDLPFIAGDKDRLIQVVINLISNAVKFTEVGQITCQVTCHESELVVKVIDTGMGISPENQPLVFEKFKQVGDTLTDKPQGTGLGLSICKEIVEHHQGRIWVESQLGIGSQFCFTLPIMTHKQ